MDIMKTNTELKLTIIFILLITYCLTEINLVNASPIDTINAPSISSDLLITVDAYLNFTSEWNNSACISWYSSLSTTELDRIFIVHSPNYLFIGGVLFDPDKKKDNSITIFLNYSTQTIKYVVGEDGTLTKYNKTGSTWVVSTTSAIAASNRSDYISLLPPHNVPWWTFELRIPKTEFNSETTLKITILHEHTYKFTSYSRYPENANTTDPTTWATLTLVSPLGYNFTLTLLDRDGDPIAYIANDTWVEIWNATDNTLLYVLTLDSNAKFSIPLKSGDYTVKTYVYGNQVDEKNYTITADLTSTQTLQNVKKVETPFGFLVVTVGYPSQLVEIDMDCCVGRGVVITNGTEVARVWVDSRARWLHLAVLYALNFSYTPFTNHLLSYVLNGTTGFVFLTGDYTKPVVYSANNTITSYIYDPYYLELLLDVEKGNYRFYSTVNPFAIVLNNTEIDGWEIDPLNITSLTVESGGNLRIYFQNPIRMCVGLHSSQTTLAISVTSPYVFPAKLDVSVKTVRGKLVFSLTKRFETTVPLTLIEIPLNLDPEKSYVAEAKLYDEITGNLVAEDTFTIPPTLVKSVVQVTPSLQQIVFENLWLILIFSAAILLIVAGLLLFR